VYSAGQVRDLAWTRPFNAIFHLSLESRRSHVRVRSSSWPNTCLRIWQSRT